MADATIGKDGAPARITRQEGDFHIAFHAMATPCEIRIESSDERLAMQVAAAAEGEARRIEQKFSRYRADSVVGKINASSGGDGLAVDGETASLLDCAEHCFHLSEGKFDVTSGVLRRAWRFDGTGQIPSAERIGKLRTLIGWEKVSWRAPVFALPAGMEIDFGGIAKEYAVDRVLENIRYLTSVPALVNFGGDLRVSGTRNGGFGWNVAIESVDSAGQMAAMLQLTSGALATSGDAQRYLMLDGVRYGHILNPRTGWPVRDAPRSVTVAASTCVEAGLTATIAMLQGHGAEEFLKREGMRAWCIR